MTEKAIKANLQANLPAKIKIGGIVYEVILCERPSDVHRDYTGLIDSENLHIRIDQKLAQGQLEKVLVHEIVHGILEHCGIKLNDEEDFVCRFSAALYQVLKDNQLDF